MSKEILEESDKQCLESLGMVKTYCLFMEDRIRHEFNAAMEKLKEDIIKIIKEKNKLRYPRT